MSSPSTPFDDHLVDPLDLIEQIVSEHGWSVERPSDEELTATVHGAWCDYGLWFTWQGEASTLLFSCALDLRVSEARRTEVAVLLALINERMWLGHFDLWADEGVLTFRHGLPLAGAGITSDQVQDLIEIGLAECERFYPAFAFVISGDKGPDDAVAAAMLETQGEA